LSSSLYPSSHLNFLFTTSFSFFHTHSSSLSLSSSPSSLPFISAPSPPHSAFSPGHTQTPWPLLPAPCSLLPATCSLLPARPGPRRPPLPSTPNRGPFSTMEASKNYTRYRVAPTRPMSTQTYILFLQSNAMK
jgi:hypothetical protein